MVDYAQTRDGTTAGIVRGMDFNAISASPAGAP